MVFFYPWGCIFHLSTTTTSFPWVFIISCDLPSWLFHIPKSVSRLYQLFLWFYVQCISTQLLSLTACVHIRMILFFTLCDYTCRIDRNLFTEVALRRKCRISRRVHSRSANSSWELNVWGFTTNLFHFSPRWKIFLSCRKILWILLTHPFINTSSTSSIY